MKNQSTQDKATARPWKLFNETCISAGDTMDDFVAQTMLDGEDMAGATNDERRGWQERAEANAALIVRAVNEHAALVAVAEAAQQIEGCSEIRPNETPAGYRRRILEPMQDALAALAEVRKEQQ